MIFLQVPLFLSLIFHFSKPQSSHEALKQQHCGKLFITFRENSQTFNPRFSRISSFPASLLTLSLHVADKPGSAFDCVHAVSNDCEWGKEEKEEGEGKKVGKRSKCLRWKLLAFKMSL